MLKLRETSLDWALKHALNLGDTDVFPLPFEYQALESDWSETREYLRGIDLLQWEVRPLRTLLAPKGKFGFRIITQVDPLDFLLYAAAIKEIGPDLARADQRPDGCCRTCKSHVGYSQTVSTQRPS
jgi:hypothetical protein